MNIAPDADVCFQVDDQVRGVTDPDHEDPVRDAVYDRGGTVRP